MFHHLHKNITVLGFKTQLRSDISNDSHTYLGVIPFSTFPDVVQKCTHQK